MARSIRILGQGYVWSRGDPLPELPTLPGFSAGPSTDHARLARMADLTVAEVTRRVVDERSQPYVAWMDGAPAAYGWSARPGAPAPRGLGPLPPDARWLWDFATLPEWRGRGIYPRLLQAILMLETDARQFWIGHVGGNEASRRGILKAGFRHVSNRVLLPSGEARMVSVAEMDDLERDARGKASRTQL